MSLSTPRPPSILHLYAELLLHIRTVTLFASLRTEHTAQTKAELSADGESIALTHEGERASIRLPTRIAGGGSATLTLPEAPTKHLTLRLQLQETSPGLLQGGARSENVVPWDASRLAECERVACRECGAELVDVNKWMDLPNENWAEMMDFWHCHKPHEHHLPGHKHDAGTDKGYAASNTINAKKGVGYVDLAHLLLVQADCPGVQVRAIFSFLFSTMVGRQEGGLCPSLLESVAWSSIQSPKIDPGARQLDCIPLCFPEQLLRLLSRFSCAHSLM